MREAVTLGILETQVASWELLHWEYWRLKSQVWSCYTGNIGDSSRKFGEESSSKLHIPF